MRCDRADKSNTSQQLRRCGNSMQTAHPAGELLDDVVVLVILKGAVEVDDVQMEQAGVKLDLSLDLPVSDGMHVLLWVAFECHHLA